MTESDIKVREYLTKLGKLVIYETNLKHIDPAQYENYELEVRARRKARELIERWITDLFQESIPFEEEPDEDNLYRSVLESRKGEGK